MRSTYKNYKNILNILGQILMGIVNANYELTWCILESIELFFNDGTGSWQN